MEEKIKRGHRKIKVGKVLSNGMDKSIVVGVERLVKHPLYGKYFRKTSKFLTHDDENTASVGDTVRIMETRPLSKRKRWRLVDIVEKVK